MGTGQGAPREGLHQCWRDARQSLSFEFFPPHTPADAAHLLKALERLETLAPDFVSLTFGAGGSRSRNTVEVSAQIMARTQLELVAHLTCVGMDAAAVHEVLEHYARIGVRNVLALRGDPPRPESALGDQPLPDLPLPRRSQAQQAQPQQKQPTKGRSTEPQESKPAASEPPLSQAVVPQPRRQGQASLSQHSDAYADAPAPQLPTAADLVSLIRQHHQFSIGVAAFPDGHPESQGPQQDLQAMQAKVDAGAQYAITQFFFRPHAFFQLRERMDAAGITIPLIAGVMPVTSIGQIQRFAQLSGTPLPNALVGRLEAVADNPAAVRAVGIEHAVDLCQRLMQQQVAGLHFYTLNRSAATVEIATQLGLTGARADVGARAGARSAA